MRVGMWVYNDNTHILCKCRGTPENTHTHDVMGVGTLWVRTYNIIIIYMFYCRVGNSFGRRLSKKKNVARVVRSRFKCDLIL